MPTKRRSAKTEAKPVPTSRLASLDAFRGFDILTMIFVNYCAGIANIPAWMKHAPSNIDGYTFVDVVFPGFLFIVGVAIPLAIQSRLAKGDNPWQILAHIIRRVAGLLLLGVVFVNMEDGRFNEAATGMGESLWTLLFFLGVIVVWSAPLGKGTVRLVHYALKAVCGIGMAWLLFIFRRSVEGGGVSWLQHEWWGILGLIGWAYLAASIIYLVTRGNRTAIMGFLALTVAIYIGDRHGSIPGYLDPFSRWESIGGLFGTDATIVLAGVLVGQLFTKEAVEYPCNKVSFMLWLGLGLYAAGMLIRPLHGISKDNGTDAYALVTAGECCLLFLAFYWVMDIWGLKKWAVWLIPVGVNPLLAYILPDIFGSFLDLANLHRLFWWVHSGWNGVANCAVMTAVILALTAGLTQARIRLKL